MTYRSVQIGCGRRGQQHLRAQSTANGLEFCAVCDLDAGKAEKAAADFEVPKHYTDFRRMLEEVRPEIVGFCAPVSVRREVILPVLEQRPKALVVDKPFAATASQAEELVEAAKEAGTLLVVCHQMRYAEEMRAVAELIRQGALGEIEEVIAQCRMNILAQGTHMLDLVAMWLADAQPKQVLAQSEGTGQLSNPGHPAADHVLLQLVYDSGVSAFCAFGDVAPCALRRQALRGPVMQISAIGSNGFAEAILGHGYNAYFADRPAARVETRPFDDEGYMTRGLYEDVAAVLDGEKSEHCSAADKALDIHRLVDAAYESCLHGKGIALPFVTSTDMVARMRKR